MNNAGYESKFTGFFRDFQRVTPRPHDPPVPVYAGVVSPLHPERNDELSVGGCGWSEEAAANACAGEGIERLFAYPTSQDAVIESSHAEWPLDEPAIAPENWVLFHPDQYARDNFPFEPLTRQTRCRWVCFRDALSGEPRWVPEEFAYLLPRVGYGHRFCPATSTGLAAGTTGQPVLLRALQEVIERDALLGAWWGKYAIEEFSQETAWDAQEAFHLQRPNLRWRFFGIASPFSRHVTMVTIEGEDREGFCFSIGSACRESRRASWLKATLEAIQGRHYVRQLRPQPSTVARQAPLETFSAHALYYSIYPEELRRTPLYHAPPAVNGIRGTEATESPDESLALLSQRLGEKSPVLFRNLTPPMLAGKQPDWRVVKVIAPGLQPVHGDDRFAHLGGRLWSPRTLSEWNETPPHPFP